MAQLNIRLDDNTRAALEAVARARDVTAADLVRECVDMTLGRTGDKGPGPDTAPRSLSIFDRLSLAVQFETLAVVDEPDAGYHLRAAKILREGLTGAYSDVFGGVCPELPVRECRLVEDIFDMFRHTAHSLSKLDADAKTALQAVLAVDPENVLDFAGFDFNDEREARLSNYGEYLVLDKGTWEELKPRFGPEHEGGNSHALMLPSYTRMLAVFTPIWERKVRTAGGSNDRYLLSVDELTEVMRAWPAPRGVTPLRW